MSEAKSKPPTFTSGMPLKAVMLQQLSDWCWRNRVIFGAGFVTNETVAGKVVSLASGAGGGGSSSTLIATCVSTSTITPASSASPPGTYGSGTAIIDIDGGAGYTAGDSVTVRNRFPTSWASGLQLVIASNDGGLTWQVINRYCPPA